MINPIVPRNTFNDIMASNLDEIKRNFSAGLKKNGYLFDEDMFMDVGIRCAMTLKDRKLSKNECIRYFWVAYNNTRKNTYKSLPAVSCDGVSDTTTLKDDSQPYDKNIDIVCNIICNAVRENFSDTEYNIWYEKIYNGKTYKELKEEYSNINILGIFRKIKKYVLQKLPQTNQEYKEHLSTLFE